MLFGVVFRPDGSPEHGGSRRRLKIAFQREGELLSLLLEKQKKIEKKIENLILKAYLQAGQNGAVLFKKIRVFLARIQGLRLDPFSTRFDLPLLTVDVAPS